VDLDSGLGETAPSHAAQSVTPLPCAEDRLDPAPGLMDGIIPGFQPGKRFPFVASPHRGRGNTERSAFRPDRIASHRIASHRIASHRIAEMVASTGAVSKDLARIIRHGIRTRAAIVDIGPRDRDPLDRSRRGVSADMSPEAMHGLAASVLDPSCLVVTLRPGRDDRRINDRACPDPDRPRLQLGRHGFEQGLVDRARGQLALEPHESGTLGCGLMRGKSAEPTKGCPIVQRFSQFDVREIMPRGQQNGLEHREWWPCGFAFWRGLKPGRKLGNRLAVDQLRNVIQ